MHRVVSWSAITDRRAERRGKVTHKNAALDAEDIGAGQPLLLYDEALSIFSDATSPGSSSGTGGLVVPR